MTPGFHSTIRHQSSAATTGTATATAIIWTGWNEAYTTATGAGGGGGSTRVLNLQATWTTWNDSYTSATTTGALGALTIGAGGNGTTSSTITTIDPWIVWNRALPAMRHPPVPRVSNEEYQRQVVENRARRDAEIRAAALEREKAKERATVILRENLTDEQKAELADKKYFSIGIVDGKTGERRTYRIHQGRSGNVEQVDAQGKRLKRFCIHPVVDCPDEDTMLVQKLMLQTREEDFLRVANHS